MVASYVRGIGLNYADTTKSYPPLDYLTDYSGHGVKALFDLGFGWSYPGGYFTAPQNRPAAAAPANLALVYDMARRADLTARSNGTGPTYAGGGFDTTPCTTNDQGVRGPNTMWASIYAAANDYFLWFGYYKMPSSGDWNTAGAFASMFAGSGTTGGFQAEADPLTVAQITIGGVPKLYLSRQTAVNASADLVLTPTADHFGKVCQIVYWRNTTGTYARMIPLLPATGTTIDLTKKVEASGAVGSNNAADFSGVSSQWGLPIAFNGTSMPTSQQNAGNARHYRGGLIDLTADNRDPLTIMNAELQTNLDRYNASAAANGGTSQIFA